MLNMTPEMLLVKTAKRIDAERRAFQAKKLSELDMDGACDTMFDIIFSYESKSRWDIFEGAQKAFRNVKPNLRGMFAFKYWWGDPAECSDEDHNARIIGLLLAAEIAKETQNG